MLLLSGIAGMGLVLGWSAVFLHGSAPAVLAARAAWLLPLAGFALIVEAPALAGAAITAGALAHLAFIGAIVARAAP